MRVTILGSGSSAPRLKRHMAGYLVEINKNKLLFDSGSGTIHQLLKVKTDLLEIGHIFYTHLHNDHISDLPAIIWSNNYGMYRKKPLNLYGPKGFKKYFNILLKKILKPEHLSYKINVRELNNSGLKINNIKIKTTNAKHFTKSIAYRIECKGKSIVYTGDTDYSENIVKSAKNADLLITECSLPKKVKNHLNPEYAGKMAQKAAVKKLVLSHFYPECDMIDVKKECSRFFKGEIIVGKDLMEISI